jgi:hypothetical protein
VHTSFCIASIAASLIDSVARFGFGENTKTYANFSHNCVESAPLIGGVNMALTVYTSKDNQWREYVNPLLGMTLERIVQLIEQGLMVQSSSGG